MLSLGGKELLGILRKATTESKIALASTCTHLRPLLFCYLLSRRPLLPYRLSQFLQEIIPKYSQHLRKLFFVYSSNDSSELAREALGACKETIECIKFGFWKLDYSELLLPITFRNLKKLKMVVSDVNSTRSIFNLLGRMELRITHLRVEGMLFNELLVFPDNLKTLKKFTFSLDSANERLGDVTKNVRFFFQGMVRLNQNLEEISDDSWNFPYAYSLNVSCYILCICELLNKTGFSPKYRVSLYPESVGTLLSVMHIDQIINMFKKAKNVKLEIFKNNIVLDSFNNKQLIHKLSTFKVKFIVPEGLPSNNIVGLLLGIVGSRLKHFIFVGKWDAAILKALNFVLSKCPSLTYFGTTPAILNVLPFNHSSIEKIKFYPDIHRDMIPPLTLNSGFLKNWFDQVQELILSLGTIKFPNELKGILLNLSTYSFSKMKKMKLFSQNVTPLFYESSSGGFLLDDEIDEFNNYYLTKFVQVEKNEFKKCHPNFDLELSFQVDYPGE